MKLEPQGLPLALAAASLCGVIWNALPESGDEPTPDQLAVHAALEDYVLGFYEAAPERLERALSPDLVKRGYWRPDDSQEYGEASLMTYEQALELAASWNVDGRRGELRPYEIELFEVCDKTACGKLTAEWGQDTFQLAKEGERWVIHHILWQSEPATIAR